MYFLSLMYKRVPGALPLFPSPLKVNYEGTWEPANVMTEAHPLDWLATQNSETVKLLWWTKDDRVPASQTACRLCLDAEGSLPSSHPHSPECPVGIKERKDTVDKRRKT